MASDGGSRSKSSNWLSKLGLGNSRSDARNNGDGLDAKSKRREQVRRAQRTHRDRKATYVKALEVEVAKLRSKEQAHDDEVKQCLETIRRLRDLLLRNNISIPPELSNVVGSSAQAMIEILGRPGGEQSIQAHMPVFDSSAPYPFQRDQAMSAAGSQTSPSSNESQQLQTSFSFADPLPSEATNATSWQQLARHPHGLDSTQVAVDFILALEQPCLTHHWLPNPEMDNIVNAGHHLMLTSPIMARAPAPTTTSSSATWTTGTKWHVPAGELEKLLEFSEGLRLEGEVTPVQAWQRMRSHANFSTLTPGGLETLRESLLSMVKCYGFGAVIDEAYFEQMLLQTFGPP